MDELLDSLPAGFLSFTDEGKIVRANATLLAMLGYERGELEGRHVESVLAVGSRIFYQTHWFPLLRMRGAADEIYLLLRPRSGEDVGVLVNAARRERAEGVTYDCVMMRVVERRKYEDELLRARRVAEEARAELEHANELLEAQALELETQQQQLLEQTTALELATDELRLANEELEERTVEAENLRRAAEEANRAKSRFLAVMSHELRTPLNAIGGYVELLDMEIYGPVTDAQRDTLGRLARSQSHLLALINDVLDLSRIEAGRVEYALEEIPVRPLVESVTPMIEPQLASKGVEFRVESVPELTVRADREKVQQILINLLGNAAKFTPAGGRVCLRAGRDPERPGRVRIDVDDTGVGIAPDKLESIFRPFVQVSDDRGERAQGSGLGLTISRDLARGMGGDLTARSEPGAGSTFSLLLPDARSPAA